MAETRVHPSAYEYSDALDTLQKRYRVGGIPQYLAANYHKYQTTTGKVTPFLMAIYNPFHHDSNSHDISPESLKITLDIGQAAAALLVAQAYKIPSASLEMLLPDDFKIPLDSTAPVEEQREFASEYLARVSNHGLSYSGERIARWLDSLSDSFEIDDARAKPFVKTSGGLAIYLFSHEIEKMWQKDVRDAQITLRGKVEGAHDIDWDFSLQELLDGRWDSPGQK